MDSELQALVRIAEHFLHVRHEAAGPGQRLKVEPGEKRDDLVQHSVDDQARGEAAAAAKCFQFRDLRAKAGTDKADATDLREAQQQLGHKSVKTTEIYLRARASEKVTPTK